MTFSESTAPAPAPEAPAEKPAKQEEPVYEPLKKTEAPVQEPVQESEEPAAEAEAPEEPETLSGPISKMSEEQKNIISDILLCFDGREER